MKKLFIILFTLVIAFTSLASLAQDSTSPIARVQQQLEELKQTDASERPKQAFQELIADLVRLNEKDHNQFLFSLLKNYEKDFKNRDFLIEVVVGWEKEGRTKTRDYAPASNWMHAANLSLGLLGALTIRKMVKAQFITAPLNQTATVAQTTSPRLRDFLEQKIAKLNLPRLATKANLISNTSGAATFVGLILLMDEQFYDAVIHGLYDHLGPDSLEFFKMFYTTKIPPYELWQTIDAMIVCENHNRLVEVAQSIENQDKAQLKASLEEINNQIIPNLESLAESVINKKRMNTLMVDGLKPKTNVQLQFALKNIETKEANPFAERVLVCDQTAISHTLSNIEHFKFFIESKLKDQ